MNEFEDGSEGDDGSDHRDTDGVKGAVKVRNEVHGEGSASYASESDSDSRDNSDEDGRESYDSEASNRGAEVQVISVKTVGSASDKKAFSSIAPKINVDFENLND